MRYSATGGAGVLSPADDKWRFFCLKRDNYLRPEDYPHIAFGSGRQRTLRCFPDKLPIGVERDRTDHLVFLYLVTRRASRWTSASS